MFNVGGIDVAVCVLDVSKYGPDPYLHHGQSRSNECLGGQNHLIAGADSGHFQCQVQRAGAAVQRNRMHHTQLGTQAALEFAHQLALAKKCAG